MTPVGRLSNIEWGWIFSASLFAWLTARSEQATAEGAGVEQVVRSAVPEAWDAGAIASILPDLAKHDVDWSKPLAEWRAAETARQVNRAAGGPLMTPDDDEIPF